MLYWYDTALKLDELLKYEKRKNGVYRKITGIDNADINNLEQQYLNKVAIDRSINQAREDDIKSLKRTKTKKNFIIGGLIGLAIFEGYIITKQIN